jgi:hypothetical protein
MIFKVSGGNAMMNRVKAAARIAVVSALVGLVLFAPALSAPAMAHPGQPVYGCPDGAVCIYHQGSGPTPFLVFYSYGPHNLSNVTGPKYWFNHQYGSPAPYAWLCSGYDGKGQVLHRPVAPHTWSDSNLDFTPVNSVVLGRPGESPRCG